MTAQSVPHPRCHDARLCKCNLAEDALDSTYSIQMWACKVNLFIGGLERSGGLGKLLQGFVGFVGVVRFSFEVPGMALCIESRWQLQVGNHQKQSIKLLLGFSLFT